NIGDVKVDDKEEEGAAWRADLKHVATDIGDKVRDKSGEDTTISVVVSLDKQCYVYGDNWGRGTEILYQAMDLNMPKKVEEMTEDEGYHALSLESVPEYAGDYLILSQD